MADLAGDVVRSGCAAVSIYTCNQLRGAALGLLRLSRKLIQNLAQLLFVLLARLPAPAPAVHRRGNRILFPPCSIREVVEVIARLYGPVQIARINPFECRILRTAHCAHRRCQQNRQSTSHHFASK